MLVGPDNGLLLPAADALGGVTAAYELTEPAYRLARVSATFHGRDVFAPAAAHLCPGSTRPGWGRRSAELVRLPAPTVHTGPGELRAEVLSVDGFGNVQRPRRRATWPSSPDRPAPCASAAGGTRRPGWGAPSADVPAGELVVLADSAGYVAVAVNRGNAAARLGVEPGDEVTVTTR